MIKHLLKFLHTMGAIGMIGALASLMVCIVVLPEPSAVGEYTRVRMVMGRIAEWLLLPSLAATLVSGLLSMAFHRGFHNAGWAWLKLALGVIMFEGTLVAVQGPMQRARDTAEQVRAGTADPALLGANLDAQWGSLWVIAAVATLNVVLGIWRPRFIRKRRSA